MSDTFAYAMGWVVQSTPNGRIVWHNGGTSAYGAFIGTAPDKDVGVIVLTNQTNVGFPDAVGEWTLDRLMDNPDVDHVAAKLTDGIELRFAEMKHPVTDKLRCYELLDQLGEQSFDSSLGATVDAYLAGHIGDWKT